MAKLVSKFNELLIEIEPDKKAIKYAVEAHKPLRDYLSNKDEEFSDRFIDSFLYGSYKRHTAVDDIKDVDIVVLTNYSENDEPDKVLKDLKSALTRYYEDPENPEYQRRSIRINEPLPDTDTEMTLDVIPAILVTDEDSPLKVPDREVGKWVDTHPRGHIKHSTVFNEESYSNERFVPLVKIVKWWWKYQCSQKQPKVKRPKPKGFWLECLVSENFDKSQDNYAEHFVTLLQKVYDKYKDIKDVPELDDPGLPGKKIVTGMSKSEFSKFLSVLKESLDLSKNALSLEDEADSSEEWRKVFGRKFPLIRKSSISSAEKKDVSFVVPTPKPWHKNE